MTLPENEASQSVTPPPKRIKLDDTVQDNQDTSLKTGLLNFCDDIILEIFSYLEPTDRFALSECCQRLQRVSFDKTLWKRVDLRSARLADSEIQKYVKFLLPSTTFIATKGPWVYTASRWLIRSEESPTFTGALLENIVKAAPNLTTFIMENHIINCQDFAWDKLPPRLEHLSFKNCYLITHQVEGGNQSFFFKIDRLLPQLKFAWDKLPPRLEHVSFKLQDRKILDLTACRWFQAHSFLALSKCKQLQEMRLADCSLRDFVPYVSISTRFGFTSLTVLDLRRTWVSDREISCLNKTPTLQELFLESPGGDRGTNMITDMAITAFGATLEEWGEMGYIVVLMPQFQGFIPSPMRVIQVCNYIGVTDTSLRHCASCLKGLQRINVCGTSCTRAGVVRFKAQRPEVAIECDYNLDVQPGPSYIDDSY